MGALALAAAFSLSLSAGASAQTRSVSIADPSAPTNEGGMVTFDVTLSLPAGETLTSDLTVDYTVSLGTGDTASATDLSMTGGTVTLGMGQGNGDSAEIRVITSTDVILENDETFTVTLSNPTGGVSGGVTLGTATATGTIADINQAEVRVRGFRNSRGLAIGFNVELFNPGSNGHVFADKDVTVAWETVDGSGPGEAMADVDFTPASGTVTINADSAGNGRRERIEVSTLSTDLASGDLTLTVRLTEPTGGLTDRVTLPADPTATGTITDASEVYVDVPEPGLEGEPVTFLLGLFQKPIATDLEVPYTISFDFHANPASAADFGDFPLTGTYTIPAGTIEMIIEVPTSDDSDIEGDETFTLQLTEPEGGFPSTVFLSDIGFDAADGTIWDNDGLGLFGGFDSLNILVPEDTPVGYGIGVPLTPGGFAPATAEAPTAWSIATADVPFGIDRATGQLFVAGDLDLDLTFEDDNRVRDYMLTVQLSQGGDTATRQVSIQVRNVNDPPGVPIVSDQAAIVGTAFTYQFDAVRDPEIPVTMPERITYAAVLSDGGALPGWLAFAAATRTFSGTPAAGDVGAVTVRVTATDDDPVSPLSSTADFEITVVGTDAPAVVVTGAYSVPEDAAVDDNVGAPPTASGFTGSGGMWSITDGDPDDEFKIDTTTGQIQVATATLDHETTPSYTLTVQFAQGGDTETADVTVTVTNVNEAPTAVGTIIPVIATVGAGSVFRDISGNFVDPDGDELSYMVTSDDESVATVSFDPTFRQYENTIIVTPISVGEATITVDAQDHQARFIVRTFTVTVVADDSCVPASGDTDLCLDSPSDLVLTMNTPVSVALPQATGGTAPYAYGIEDAGGTEVAGGMNVAPGVSLATDTGILSGTPTGTQAQTAFTYVATDAGTGRAERMFTITVNAAPTNAAPRAVGLIDPVRLDIDGNPGDVDVSGNFMDPDRGDTLTYEAASDDESIAAVSVSGSTVTITPGVEGDATITVTARDDGGLPARQEFEVLVRAGVAVDIAADIAGDDIVNIAEKAAGFDITGTTEAGASVSVAVGAAAARSASVSGTTWTFAVAGGAAEITGAEVDIVATASLSGRMNGQAMRTLTLDLEAPTATYTAPGSLTVDMAITAINPGSPSADTATYALQAGVLPPGLELDPDTGAITGTPIAGNADTADVVIRLTDDNGNTGDVPITFPAVARGDQTLSDFLYTPASVRLDQDPPALTVPTGAQTGSTLSYSAEPADVCTVESGTGALTLVGVGACTVTVTAAQTDNHNEATAETMVTITPAPSLSGVTPIDVAENAAVNDDIGSPLTPENFPSGTAMWSITDGNTDGAFAIDSGTGQLSVAQPLDFDTPPTSYTLTVRLEQGDGAATAQVPITVTDVDDLLVTIAAGIADDDVVNIAEKAAGFDITGTTEAGASVSVTIDGGSERSATVSGTDWTVSIPAADSAIAGTSVTVAATATMSGATDGATVRTLAVDLEAPTATYAAPASLTVGEAITAINPGSPSPDAAAYAVQTGDLPPGLALDPDTGAITGTPTAANASTAAVAIGLTDSSGNPGDDIDITFPIVARGAQTLDGFAYTPNMLRFDERNARPPVLTAPTVSTPTGDPGGAVTYSAAPSDVCTADQETGALTLAGIGVCTVTATAAQTADYNATSATAEVRVGTVTVSLSPDAVAVVEGETAEFTVTVSDSPEIAVTVAYTLALDGANPAAESDFASFQANGTVTFEIGATALTRTISIETADDDVEEPGDPETFTVSLGAPTGGFAAGVELLRPSSETSAGSILDNDTTTVSVDLDVEAEEGGAARFTARLSNPFDEDVTLAWTTVDPPESATDAAEPGRDYVRTSGRLAFPAGATEQTFEVPTLRDDDTEEGDEILTVRLEAPAGSTLPQGVTLAPDPLLATATIRNSAVSATSARLSRVNAAVLPRVAQAMVASTLEAIVGRIDSASPGDQASSLPGKSNVMAALESRARTSGTAAPDLERALSGSSFVLSLNASEERGLDGVGPVSVWGSGDYRRLSGPDDSVVDWDGDMFGFVLGADAWLRPDLLAGLSVSRHAGSFDYTDRAAGSATGAVKGDLDSHITGVHPYVSWSPADGAGLWATAGYGEGEVEIGAEGGAARHKSDTRFTMAAAGASYTLLSNDDWIEGGAATLRIKGQGSVARLNVKGKDPIQADDFRVRNLRLALEGRYDCQSGASGGCLSPSLEIGGRHDSGDGRTGTGFEIGGGLRYADRAAGLIVEGRGRVLLADLDDGEDWGVGGQVLFDPGGDSLGLSVRLTPSFGDAASKVERLYGPDSSDLATATAERPSGRMETEIGYGLAGDGGFGIATPYAGVSLAELGARTYRTGIRFKAGPALRISLEGEVEERAAGAADRQVTLRGRLAW